MNLIIIHGEVYKVNKKDFNRTIELQNMEIKLMRDEEYEGLLIQHHKYISERYDVIQINPPTLMY